MGRLILLLLIISLLHSISFAQESSVKFTVYKAGEPLRDSFLLLELSNSTNSFSSVKKTDANGEFTLLLSEGEGWKARALTFDKQSNVNGISQESAVDNGANYLYVFPAGTVLGIISLASGGQPGNATVDAECASPLRSLSFSAGPSFTEFLPAGKCRLTAHSNGESGSAEVEIFEGKTSEMGIALSSGASFAGFDMSLLAPVAIVLAAFAYFALALKRKSGSTVRIPTKERELAEDSVPEKQQAQEQLVKSGSEKGEPAEEPAPEQQPQKSEPAKRGHEKHELAKNEPTKKMKDILATLDERQKAVVEFLISQPEKKARQSKIRYACKIPKTSFFRVIRSLEKKNILNSEKYLNTKEIALTSWFLSE